MKEPVFTAPFAAVVLPLIILTVLGIELNVGAAGQPALFDAYGLNPLLIRQGHGELLFTYAFLHGNLIQAIINAGILLVFGVPLTRAFGGGGWAFVSLFMLFVVTSAAAGLAFCLAHLHDNITVIGASAAASGLMGASARLPWRGGDVKILPFTHPQVLALTGFVVFYHVFALLTHRVKPTEMAWESHLAAYAVGLVLISPWLHVFHRRYFTTN